MGFICTIKECIGFEVLRGDYGDRTLTKECLCNVQP